VGSSTPGRSPARAPAPAFAHLASLTDRVGLFEHALFAEPRREHGYCTDDVSRALAVVVRQPDRHADLDRLLGVYLTFVEDAQLPDGRFHNRRAADGAWVDDVGSGDSQGRALFGLGVAAAGAPPEYAARALRAFERGAESFHSPSPRANAHAAISAAEVIERHPGHRGAVALASAAAAGFGARSGDPQWPWPEPRLAYENARLAEGRLAAGVALDRPDLVEEGLALLRWLVTIELANGHFSFTPAGGWEPGEPRPGFDQQPIEAGAMAEACARAYRITGESRFADLCLLSVRWFLGANDTGVALLDSDTGGCCDGLERDGRNENMGAESTLVALAALQAAARSAPSSSSADTNAAPTFRSAAP